MATACEVCQCPFGLSKSKKGKGYLTSAVVHSKHVSSDGVPHLLAPPRRRNWSTHSPQQWLLVWEWPRCFLSMALLSTLCMLHPMKHILPPLSTNINYGNFVLVQMLAPWDKPYSDKLIIGTPNNSTFLEMFPSRWASIIKSACFYVASGNYHY